MKKKIFLFLAILFCLGAALTLTACGGEPAPTPGGTETPHTHALTRHAAVAATCTTEGCLEYWECTTCGKFFPDSSAHAELADLHSMAIPALGHDPVNIWKSDETGHWHKCTRTGCTAQVNKTAHTPAAWSSDATNHWKDCTVCGYDTTLAAHTYNVQNICTACCAHVYEEIGLVFTLNKDTYTVTDCTGTATEVVIPATYKGIAVTSIGDYAFRDCFQLTTITIPAGVTSIGDYAFYNCSKLTTVEFGANSKLTSIGRSAFNGCSQLTTITMPDSVTSIGNYAFYKCPQLTTVYYGGSASDWGNITIDSSGNSNLTSATRYYYSATEPAEAGNWWYYDNGQPKIWE